MTTTIVASTRLSASDVSGVLAAAEAVAKHDGVAALSEAFALALAEPAEGVHHVVAQRDGHVIGYAGLAVDGSAELLVVPDARRAGVGGALLDQALAVGATRLWAHRDLPAARGLAAARGLRVARELHRMSRPLTDPDREPPALPTGFVSRTFVSGADDEVWIDLNAAAFVHHPEQGRLTLSDLTARQAQPWFDPAGFFLVEDRDHPERGPIAFHWTKIEPGSAEGSSRRGEVYVVGVHPAYQGRGLARPLTRLGIAHLASRGCAQVDLYVDGDNAAALATYAKEGFTIAATDVMYAVASAECA